MCRACSTVGHPFAAKRKRGLMDRSKSRTNLGMIYIAVISVAGKGALYTDDEQRHCYNMPPLWQEVDRCIAKAVEKDGRLLIDWLFIRAYPG